MLPSIIPTGTPRWLSAFECHSRTLAERDVEPRPRPLPTGESDHVWHGADRIQCTAGSRPPTESDRLTPSSVAVPQRVDRHYLPPELHDATVDRSHVWVLFVVGRANLSQIQPRRGRIAKK